MDPQPNAQGVDIRAILRLGSAGPGISAAARRAALRLGSAPPVTRGTTSGRAAPRHYPGPGRPAAPGA